MSSHYFHVYHHLVSLLLCLSESSRLSEWKDISLSTLQKFLGAFDDFHTLYFRRWNHYQNKKKVMSLLAFLGCFLSLSFSLSLSLSFPSRKQVLWTGWCISDEIFFVCCMWGQFGLQDRINTTTRAKCVNCTLLSSQLVWCQDPLSLLDFQQLA